MTVKAEGLCLIIKCCCIHTALTSGPFCSLLQPVSFLFLHEGLRHGCDDSLLFLTYFDLPFDVACALLGFFYVTTGNSSCSQAF